MKRKHLLLLIVVCICSKITYGQMFNTRYIFDQTAVVFRTLHPVEEDTLLVVGLGTTWDFPYPGKLMLTKFDHYGEMLSYDLESADSIKTYYPLGSSLFGQKLFIVGGVGTGLAADNGGFYALYNLYSGIEWFNEIEADADAKMFFLDGLAMSNNLFLILGVERVLSNYTSARLYCINLQGDIVWEQQYDSPEYHVSSGSITALSDSVFLIGLQKGPSTSQDFITKASIMKVDEMGNILSEWNDDEPTPTFRPQKILITEDEGILFAGKAYGDNPWPGARSYICHLDSAYNKLWTIKTGIPSSENYLNNMIQSSDGNFIAVGNTLDSLANSIELVQSGYLIKFDIEGSIIWEKRYYGIESLSEHNKFYDIIELEDESLVLCGESVDLNADSFPAHGWLVRLDSNGQLDSTSSLEIIYSYSMDDLLLFPNPADTHLTVEFENERIRQIEIFNASGQLMQSQSGDSHKVELDVAALAPGIYFLKVNNRYSKKFVVE